MKTEVPKLWISNAYLAQFQFSCHLHTLPSNLSNLPKHAKEAPHQELTRTWFMKLTINYHLLSSLFLPLIRKGKEAPFTI